MTRQPEAEIAHLTELIYRAEAEKLRALTIEENRLRAKLEHLERVRRAAREEVSDACSGYRGMGGDVLWHAWLGRNKVSLQGELARLLGKKGLVVRQLQRSFGKHEAACRIIEAMQQQAKRHGAAQEMRSLEDFSLYRSEQQW